MAVCNFFIENNIKLPKEIYLCYPLLNINPGNYSPSNFITLIDFFMSYGLSKVVFQAYLGNN